MIFILVPYRNREKQLEIFTKYTKYLFQVNNVEVRIIICQQENEKPFNRGLILNYGFNYLLTTKQINENDIVIISDIDCLCPENRFNHYIRDPENTIRHIYGYSHLFHNLFYSLGTVISFKPKVFIEVNGFPNNFWGWGAEDLALGYRVMVKEALIDNRDLIRINDKDFYQFENPIEEPNLEHKLLNNSKNLNILVSEINNNNLITINGLSTLDLKVQPTVIIKRDYEVLGFDI